MVKDMKDKALTGADITDAFSKVENYLVAEIKQETPSLNVNELEDIKRNSVICIKHAFRKKWKFIPLIEYLIK